MREPKQHVVLLIFLALLLYSRTFPQNNYDQLSPPLFETISVEDGLPEGSVTCILQDYLGYMWFGTKNGLARYDGYSMTVYKSDTTKNARISGRVIIKLFEDKNKTLWVGTLTGLNRFNRKDESFTSYRFNPNDTNSISSDLVHTIYEDRTDRFWIGTQHGLNLFDRESGRFTRYYFTDSKSKAVNHIEANQHSLGINAITEDPVSGDLLLGTSLEGLWRFNINERQLSRFKFQDSVYVNKNLGCIQNFCKSRDGRLWMATINSVCRLDPISKEFKCYFDFPIKELASYAEPGFLSGSVVEDQSGNIAAGFFAEEIGLIYLNPNTGLVSHYELIPNKSKNTWLNKIHSLYIDRSGIIWIGTWSFGVKKWERYEDKFSALQSYGADPNHLSSPIVYSLICDPKGYTWYCTPKGLDRYDQRTHTYNHYLEDVKCVTDFMVYGMTLDHSGNLWLGTSNCGLVEFNTQSHSYRFHLNDPAKQNLLGKTVLYLIQDHLGYIWIGTLGFGVYQYDPRNGDAVQFKNDPGDPQSLSENQAVSILEDHKGDLWVGTNSGGLNKYNRQTGKFTYVGFKNCLSLYEDNENRFWVAEYLTGINLFDTDKLKVIENFSQADGLVSNTNMGITEDNNKNLWFINDAGISSVNPVSKTVKNFVVENKLSDVFNFVVLAASGMGYDGTMYINSRRGLVVFNPENVIDDPTPPQVLISDLSLFNRPGEQLHYNGFTSNPEEITLTYDQNDLRFDYVGLQYNEPLKNTYKYILENFDEDWVEAGTQRNAVYTNLNPGKYIFRVKAANSDGIWSPADASIKIVITPPWWKTPAAYLLYIMSAIGLISLTWMLQLKRIRIKHEYEMSRFEAEKLHEVDEIKSKFFTNISHEFRTPLTLIIGPVKELSEKIADRKVKEKLNVVQRNANKLLSLVNQLLDISKIESGNMKLKAEFLDVTALIKALVLSFVSFAERKQIKLNFNSPQNEIQAYVDKGKIEQIINNVLSNAFKFTPEGGSIEVNLIEKYGNFIVSISDTGIGIPVEKLPKIFDRFYQVDAGHKREYEGTGIGLALTKELVELHKGMIEVESTEGKGTTATISIPVGEEDHKTEETSGDDTEEYAAIESEIGNGLSIIQEDQGYNGRMDNDAGLNTEEQPLLLIVEDNTDVREYIKNNLDNGYKILEAGDGEDGWNKSLDHIPDLIISDVMMPKMDGFELCKKLKTDERTSHIPLILLTAKATSEDKIEGYETGADEYIMKPFDSIVLKARIKNLIEQRKRIHEHFRQSGLIELDESEITSIDKKFLRKTTSLINNNISDVSFSVEKLAECLNMSRSVLHKKVVSLTGEPPVELVRTIRMNRAAELIRRKAGNITEISLEVGFKNPAYFSECFKKQFGVSPSQYSRQFSNN